MAIANVVVGGVGSVYMATQSMALAALALGGVAFVWLVMLVRRRDHDR